MNAPTTHIDDDANEAQFLAPETHQKAGQDWQCYPTPDRLADKACRLFKNRDVERLLDACAGAGALADAWSRQSRKPYYRRSGSDIDAIEIDARHHPTLREKAYNVVGLDFLEFEGGAIYSHVVMNPPFAQGARFALKAWDMLWEGEVVAILNAETLHNPFSAERKRLASLVAEHGSVEFIAEAFVGADVERQTTVEIALVHLAKPARCAEDWIGPVIDSLAVEQAPDDAFELPHELALPTTFVASQCLAFRAAVRAMRAAVRGQAVAANFAERIGETMERRQGCAVPSGEDTSGAAVRSSLRERSRTEGPRLGVGAEVDRHALETVGEGAEPGGVRAGRAREPGFYSSRYDDPLRALVSGHAGDADCKAASERLATAIDGVLARHGLLAAITHEPQGAGQALLLEA